MEKKAGWNLADPALPQDPRQILGAWAVATHPILSRVLGFAAIFAAIVVLVLCLT